MQAHGRRRSRWSVAEAMAALLEGWRRFLQLGVRFTMELYVVYRESRPSIGTYSHKLSYNFKVVNVIPSVKLRR